MKSIKVIALILGSIALLPSASFADNINFTTQETNLDSHTVGHGNTGVTETYQGSFHRQKGIYYDKNIKESSQRINVNTITIGNDNIELKKAIQKAVGRQINR